MKEYQKRVVEEQKELGKKIEKLHAYILTNINKESDEMSLLVEQRVRMVAYENTLLKRIKLF